MGEGGKMGPGRESPIKNGAKTLAFIASLLNI